MSTKKTSTKTLSLDEVRHIAKLANLPMTEEQIKKIAPQLSTVIDFMSQIQSLDTKGVVETSQVTGLENVLREDKVDEKRTLTQDEALSNAKQTHDGYFVVPAVLEE